MKKKYVVASALALAMSVGLVTSPKAEASSSAKYYFKQYKTVRKYKHGIKAIFAYKLPQLKGNSAAIKEINKSLRKNYTAELKHKKELFEFVKWYSKHVGIHETYDDIVKPRATYNKHVQPTTKMELSPLDTIKILILAEAVLTLSAVGPTPLRLEKSLLFSMLRRAIKVVFAHNSIMVP